MPDIGTVLFQALGGGPEEVDDYDDPDSWRDDVIEIFGSVSKAARELGVPRSTLRGWLAGREPKRGADWFSGRLLRAARPTAVADRIRDLPATGVRIHGTFRYDGGGSMKGAEDRDVPIGEYLAPYVLADLADAYVEGAGPEQLAEIFADNIIDGGFYSQTFSGDAGGEWVIDYIDGLG